MARYKLYLETDVLTEARRRIAHVFDIFDSVVVMFSGGKDSAVCMSLVHDEAKRRGLLPVQTIFRDEELIPNDVIAHVDHYRQLPWVNMRWYCLPMKSTKYVLGRRERITFWDPTRPWVRQMPEWAITNLPGMEAGGEVTQHSLDDAAATEFRGKVAFIVGIRASESLIRYRSVVNKLSENYICVAIGSKPTSRVRLVKPIYDWSEDDVFQYLGESGAGWSPCYDWQLLAGQNLRVSTPLHVEAAKRFGLMREIDPEFYGRLVAVFPEMILQERYYSDFDSDALIAGYAKDGWPGCQRFIEEMIEPGMRAIARGYVKDSVLLGRQDATVSVESTLKGLLTDSIERAAGGASMSRSMSDSRVRKAKARV